MQVIHPPTWRLRKATALSALVGIAPLSVLIVATLVDIVGRWGRTSFWVDLGFFLLLTLVPAAVVVSSLRVGRAARRGLIGHALAVGIAAIATVLAASFLAMGGSDAVLWFFLALLVLLSSLVMTGVLLLRTRGRGAADARAG